MHNPVPDYQVDRPLKNVHIKHCQIYAYYFSLCLSFLEIDECQNAVCLHGAACRDQVNGYSCVCQAGYTGKHCQTGWYKNMNNISI
jgi:hypothetical protein